MRWFRKSIDSQTPAADSEPLFECRSNLLSSAEQAFFHVLQENLTSRYCVFGKIAPTCIVDIKPEVPEPEQRLLRQELTQQVIDFVICEVSDFKILGVVMLEDMPKDQVGRRLFDSLIDRLMAAVGIPVVHIPVQPSYSAQELKIEISRSLFVEWRDAQGDHESPASAEITTQQARQSRTDADGQNGYGFCPVCGSAYVKRQAKSGKFAGKFFLACANYPECKNLRLLKTPAPRPGSPNRR
jgi:hypothetical protein